MLDKEAAIPAPYVSSEMAIDPAWIDYNGHLNVAYYNVLFDRAVDEFYDFTGLGPDYLKERNHSTMAVETHVRYLREVHLGTPLRITVQLIDFDAKRFHLFEELKHATEGWVSATSESMTVHVDMTAKKVVPFPADIMAKLARLKAAHAVLLRPEAAGRRIAMPAPK